MLYLTASTDAIQVITGGTQALAVHASWMDLVTGTATPGRTNTAIASAATTSVVAGPSSGQRNLKTLSIRNKDASASDTITVQHTDGTTVAELIKFTLLAGYTLTYNEGAGWILTDTSGAAVLAPTVGRYLKTTVLTAASASFTTGPSTTQLYIRGVGGGGGGAGCTSVASAWSAGGGGGAGAYVEKAFAVTPNTAYAYTCGALGAGASGAAGGNGGSSTFVVGATTVTAPGGTGAPVATATPTVLVCFTGGTGGTVATNGDMNCSGDNGEGGIIVAITTPIGSSGKGAASEFGGGGKGIVAVGNGVNASGGFGAGGGGAMTQASTIRTGGSGTAGCWVVDEFS